MYNEILHVVTVKQTIPRIQFPLDKYIQDSISIDVVKQANSEVQLQLLFYITV